MKTRYKYFQKEFINLLREFFDEGIIVGRMEKEREMKKELKYKSKTKHNG